MMTQSGFWWVLLALAIYGILHSLLASRQAKALAARIFGDVGRRYYRIFFVLFVIPTFFPVLALVFLLPDKLIYTIPFPWIILSIIGQLLALWGLRLAFRHISLGRFLGTAQLDTGWKSLGPEKLVTGGVFRWVRHPLYLFSIVFIWLMPVMTWNILAFDIGASLYMLIGSIFEERKLVAQFGQEYIQYRRKTPHIIPGTKFQKKDRR
jgi:protein-S-isoprenylcysteine O-methyltransferase Ste14